MQDEMTATIVTALTTVETVTTGKWTVGQER